MPTSKTTNEEIVEIILSHISLLEAKKMFKELSTIKGNQSFKVSIEKLNKLLERQKVTN